MQLIGICFLDLYCLFCRFLCPDFPYDRYFYLARVFQFLFYSLGYIVSQHLRALIINIIRLNKYSNFPSGLNGISRCYSSERCRKFLELFKAFPDEVVGALRRLRCALKNPPMTPALLLAAMSRQDLPASAAALGGFVDAL